MKCWSQLHSLTNSLKMKRVITLILLLSLIVSLTAITVYATTNTDVAGTAKSAFDTYMKPQIMDAVNGVVFPVIDVILGIFFIVRLVMAGVTYRNNPGGTFAWHVPAILFCGLVISITAPLWAWKMIGWK